MNTDPDWQPQHMPTLLINRLARLLSRPTDEGLREVGLTASQLPVLVALKNGEALTQKELADLAGVEQPSMAQLLSRMERDGMIRRSPSPNDRRSSLISLTEQARGQLEPGRGTLRRLDEQACAVLSEAERQQLAGLLHRLIGHAQSWS